MRSNTTTSYVLQRVAKEVAEAREKFPQPNALMAALTEEVGELAKALMEEPAENVRAEAIQVAAMAIRIYQEGDPTLDDIRVNRGAERLVPAQGGVIDQHGGAA